jgi:hypothetical protein
MGLVGLLAMGGCVDMFTGDPPATAPTARWRGVTTAGPPTIPECAPMRLNLAIYEHPLYFSALVNGRAYPQVTPVGPWPRTVESVTSWWAEGYMNPDSFVQFETRRQRPIYFRAKPYAVWQGWVTGDQLALVEAGSPCNREVVLSRR